MNGNKTSVISAVIAVAALLGSILVWLIQGRERVTAIEGERKAEEQWVKQWMEERGKRLDAIERRQDAHERKYHPTEAAVKRIDPPAESTSR